MDGPQIPPMSCQRQPWRMTLPRAAGIVRLAATGRGHPHMTRARFATLARLLSLVIASASLGAPAAAQTPSGVDMDDLLAVMDRLMLKLPMNVYGRDPVRRL